MENTGFDRQIKEITHVPEEEFVEGDGGGPGEHEDVRPGAGLIGTSGECAVDDSDLLSGRIRKDTDRIIRTGDER